MKKTLLSWLIYKCAAVPGILLENTAEDNPRELVTNAFNKTKHYPPT